MSVEKSDELTSVLKEGRSAWKETPDLGDPAWPLYPDQLSPCEVPSPSP